MNCMTLRSLSLAGAFVLAATLVAHAADITGKWTAQVPGRDGQTRETTFNFKVDGEKLTGTTTGMAASFGGAETPIVLPYEVARVIAIRVRV